MTNPQDNPGTPPPPTPSNSSTPPPPSKSPKPRLRRASQVQDSNSNSDSESYKSASEGEGPGSSDSEKAQESPSKVSSSLTENLETRFVLVGPIRDMELPELQRSEEWQKVRGSGYGEIAEGLVNLSAQGDEPGSSTEETLADLLKKVGASYDPKKRITPTPKAPSAPKPSKKRKASSPTTTETSLPKGRSTRSRVK
uniref:Uncharacterized protein n=1 Tax=Nicotiana tabacum TaxID=4097 RepID=A0A1S4BSZ8_TOBAC|nr:PREDICTED: putative uncharacterized protein DDB_G0290521 [Nicotiana tabacum]